jgi:transcriptional regulator with GAF, ATPase, and Fis domain
MGKFDSVLSRLPDDEKRFLYNLVAFPDFFSVDWFSGMPDFLPSKLISVIFTLNREQWITAEGNTPGCYQWSKKFPRQEIIDRIPAERMSRYYRNSVDILTKYLPDSEENTLKLAHQCLLAGIETIDLNIIFKAALYEEKKHKISSAITLYDSLLEFIENLIVREDIDLSSDTWCTFIRIIERRASLSLFHPSLKRVNRFLTMALDMAIHLGDRRTQASLQLLIGQNYWMSFQHEKAVQHFDVGWDMINAIKDDHLSKRGLQLQGLSYWIKGKFCDAIQAYEESLGEIDSTADDDFILLTALHLALCYTQVGMPQRGLGITEAIERQAEKNENWPLVSLTMATTGVIFLEIRKLKNSKTYFERALELAKRENIPMAEVMSGIGMANIECLEGNYNVAAEHFKALWKLRKSSWYHTLNSSHVFEAGYMLHIKDVSPVELSPVINFLYQLKEEDVNPFMYSIIRRHQILILEKDKTPRQKIEELLKLEKSVKNSGATLELAKIRIDLARLFVQTNNWQEAEIYGRKAWEFLKPIAKDVYPAQLEHLIPQDDVTTDDRLFDLVIEMGEALTNQENIERLLTNIITSISRLTGAERAALFIRDKRSSDLKLVASRNVIIENIKEEDFNKTFNVIKTAANSNDGAIIQYKVNRRDSVDFRHVIITPLKLLETVIGVLYQDSRFFSFDTSPDKINLLSALASQIAVSIDRAQAYDEIARLNKRLIQENLYYMEEKEEFRPFGEIIGNSQTITDLHHLIHKVAPTQSTVLISGETGVGKELVARAIHRESARQNGPFIRVNCAALPDTLIDSELFGHEKGAFTGAVKTKAGRFELAHEGTIFLDEVSELPPSTQSRLLRILQEKEFQRVGGTATLHSDFRLITATNKDLGKEVASGKFRADLFYRLNVFPISVAPLRERKEDIPLLATHFLNLFCSQYNKQYSGIPESEMEKLITYSWPGNIRELSNMVERAVILGGPVIRFAELESKKTVDITDDEVLDLKDMEKMQILKALKKTNGKIGGKNGASVLLGLKRTTLINRMKRLGITVEKNAIPQ